MRVGTSFDRADIWEYRTFGDFRSQVGIGLGKFCCAFPHPLFQLLICLVQRRFGPLPFSYFSLQLHVLCFKPRL